MALVHEKLYQCSNFLARLAFADYAASLVIPLARPHQRPGSH